MTHRHFCLDALSGKCLEIITRKGGKLSHLIAIPLSSAEENKPDKLPSELPFLAFRALGVLLEEAPLKEDELSRFAWELLSSLGKYLEKGRGK